MPLTKELFDMSVGFLQNVDAAKRRKTFDSLRSVLNLADEEIDAEFSRVLASVVDLPERYTWLGKFNSSRAVFFGISSVCGNIHVTLPANIKDTVSAPAILTYIGLYRNGQNSIFNFSYADEEARGNGHQVGYIGGFKGSHVMTHQCIRFNITMMSDTAIRGSYESENPKDEGFFHIERLA